jgi:hypothetical protein
MKKQDTEIRDAFKRSAAKSATGKIIEVTIDSLIFSPFAAASLSLGLAVAVELLCLATILGNERAWNRLNYGREVTEGGKINERLRRTVLKGTTGRTLEVLLDTLVISAFIDVKLSFALAVTVEIVCFLTDCANDRLWNLTSWNRKIILNSVQPPDLVPQKPEVCIHGLARSSCEACGTTRKHAKTGE